jgi:hypothetical protein
MKRQPYTLVQLQSDLQSGQIVFPPLAEQAIYLEHFALQDDKIAKLLFTATPDTLLYLLRAGLISCRLFVVSALRNCHKEFWKKVWETSRYEIPNKDYFIEAMIDFSSDVERYNAKAKRPKLDLFQSLVEYLSQELTNIEIDEAATWVRENQICIMDLEDERNKQYVKMINRSFLYKGLIKDNYNLIIMRLLRSLTTEENFFAFSFILGAFENESLEDCTGSFVGIRAGEIAEEFKKFFFYFW